MNRDVPALLIVDDIEANLLGLAERLRQRLPEDKIGTWLPQEADGSPADAFDRHVGEDTVLVVTDYDLTTTVKGLFGLSIVGWCQNRGIPVGEYSRANVAALPHEPNLFELRVPTDEAEAAKFVACIFKGFRELRTRIIASPELIAEGGSLAWVLSVLLGRLNTESQFAAYMSRLNSANASLVETLRSAVEGGRKPDDASKQRLLTYVLGHVLVNSVLKYPGPVINEDVLCAYLTTTLESFPDVVGLFENAQYLGPFSDESNLYWRDDVDKVLDQLSEKADLNEVESFGDFNRRVVEVSIDGELASHNCERCDGRRGGFWCPFTRRTVCERSDCSVPGSSWIPVGASLCRVERDFFDEWSPILGL